MKKGFLAVIVVIFVLLMGGAYLMYQSLSGMVGAETLVETTETHTETEEMGETAEETVENEPTAQKREEKQEDPSEEGETLAPDFTVFDREGNEAKLSDFFGKPIVLNFWASWCGPCKSEMPTFNEKFLENGDEVQFLMVNMTDGAQETKDTANAYLDGQDFSFPVYYDTNMDAAATYGVWSLPTTYFVDANGVLTAQAKSAIDGQTLQKGIDMILE